MAKLASAAESIKFVERTLLGLVLVALIVRFTFHYQAGLFLQVFSVALALVYFPFGFYFIGKPSENYSKTIGIVLGFIYALGIMAVLLSAVNMDANRYPLIGILFVLLALVVYMVVKLRSASYPETFVNAQFIRIAFIVLISLVVLIS